MDSSGLRTPPALDAIAMRFRAWYDSGPTDIGMQTSAVLRAAGPAPSAATMAATAADLHARTGHTGGNGSLMRTSAVALAHLDNPAALVEAAMAVSALTHTDERAQQACAIWCLTTRHAILTGELDAHTGLVHLRAEARASWTERLAEAETRRPETFAPNGYTVTALQAAWSAITHTPIPAGAHACRHFAAALYTAIGIGHDTDTVASIAGALLGARWGASAVPAAWRRVAHGYPGLRAHDLEKLAYLTVHGGQPGRYGWPSVEHIDYRSLQVGNPPLVRHPLDDGVYLAAAIALDDLPVEVDAVVSLCLVGTCGSASHHLGLAATFRALPLAGALTAVLVAAT